MAVTKIILVPKLRFPEFNEKWHSVKIEDFAPLQRGFDLPVSKIKTGPFPVVFSNGALKTHVKYKAIAPGVITGRSGTIGKVHFIEENYWPHNTSLWVTDYKGNYPKYVYFVYKRLNLKKFSTGSGVPTLNRNNIHSYKIVVPNLDEQQKIADFLTQVDNHIDLQQKKLDLLKKYKQGLMQQIFSQKLRFKDDNGNEYPKWKERKLGDVFNYAKGTGLSKDDIIADGRNLCVLYGELYTTYSEVIYKVLSRTNKLEGTKSIKGDLLVPCSTTTSGIDLANITEITYNNVLLGGDITILRPKDAECSRFFAYYLTHYKTHDISSYAQGSTIVHLYFNHFKKMIINIPSTKEQQKIANFITFLDDKIMQEERKVEQFQQFKKPLLQQMFI